MMDEEKIKSKLETLTRKELNVFAEERLNLEVARRIKNKEKLILIEQVFFVS